MRKFANVFFAAGLLLATAGCKTNKTSEQPAQTAVPVETSEPRIYVTDEVGGDLTVIDSGNYNVLATLPLGKRPRGIHASPDHKTIYVAVSGSPHCRPRCGRKHAAAPR